MLLNCSTQDTLQGKHAFEPLPSLFRLDGFIPLVLH